VNEPAINLYAWATPKGWKASYALEEFADPYDDLSPFLGRSMAVIEKRPGCAAGVTVPQVTYYNDANEHETDKFVSEIQGIVGR
jgi:hypothetical protein